MYHRFYGLSRLPFDVTPDPTLMYMCSGHREALATLIYGVECRKGFLVCTGEVGMGKTTILRAYFDQANSETLKLIYIMTPRITPAEITEYICRELDIGGSLAGFDGIQKLQAKLLELYLAGKTVGLIIDEAQALPAETIEHLRLLSNFETNSEKLIQIILVGQPELDSILAAPEMRQVNQRVTLRSRLRPFGIADSGRYMEFRLVKSGAEAVGQVLSPGAVLAIAEAADGIPRRINVLADNVLIAGYGADERPVGRRLARQVVADYLDKSGFKSMSRWRFWR